MPQGNSFKGDIDIDMDVDVDKDVDIASGLELWATLSQSWATVGYSCLFLEAQQHFQSLQSSINTANNN